MEPAASRHGRGAGGTILAALGVVLVPLSVALVASMISPYCIINPKTGILAVFALLLLVVETSLGMVLRRRG